MYKTVFFDMDGTIADSSLGIIRSVEYSLNKFGIKVKDINSLKKFIGPPLKYSFMNFYGFSELQAYAAADYYRERYSEIGLFETELYAGIIDILKDLKARKVKIAVASSKPEFFLNQILNNCKIASYFDFVGGAELNGERSEKPEVIEYTINQLKITDRKDIIMVGDRYFDLAGAKAANLDCVGVLYGFGNREEMEEYNPVAILEDMPALKRFLAENTAP